MYRMIYPYASADEVRRLLFENNPNNPTIFSRCDIYRSEKIIGLTNKRGSTTGSKLWNLIILFVDGVYEKDCIKYVLKKI